MKKIKLIIERKEKKRKLRIMPAYNSKGRVGYVLGTVDGTIIAQQNANKIFYGASMPKLPMALAQMRKFKDVGQALTNDELSSLLDYSKKSKGSNEMFRAICGGKYKYDKGKKETYSRKSGPELGTPSIDDEKEFAKGIDLEKELPSICRTAGRRPGKKKHPSYKANQQTPLGYFKFLSLIHQADQLAHEQDSKLMSLPSDSKNEIVDVFLRPVFKEIQLLCKGLRTKFKKLTQPERKTFNIINQVISKKTKGKAKKLSMWGKGGYTTWKPAIHMGFVIDETYILSLYTYYGNEWIDHEGRVSKPAVKKLFANEVYEILSKNNII